MRSVAGGRLRLVAAGCLAVPAAGLLTACGPPSSTSASEPPTTAPSTSSSPADAGQSGGKGAEALAAFACAPGPDGGWTATGTLTNDGQNDASFVVTFVVAGPDSTAAQAKRQVVTVPSGESEPIQMDGLPAPPEGELSCQAQVVRQ